MHFHPRLTGRVLDPCWILANKQSPQNVTKSEGEKRFYSPTISCALFLSKCSNGVNRHRASSVAFVFKEEDHQTSPRTGRSSLYVTLYFSFLSPESLWYYCHFVSLRYRHGSWSWVSICQSVLSFSSLGTSPVLLDCDHIPREDLQLLGVSLSIRSIDSRDNTGTFRRINRSLDVPPSRGRWRLCLSLDRGVCLATPFGFTIKWVLKRKNIERDRTRKRQSARLSMATMTTASVQDVSPKGSQTRLNPMPRIDLGNIADVPYYVESNLILVPLETSSRSLVHRTIRTSCWQYRRFSIRRSACWRILRWW